MGDNIGNPASLLKNNVCYITNDGKQICIVNVKEVIEKYEALEPSTKNDSASSYSQKLYQPECLDSEISDFAFFRPANSKQEIIFTISENGLLTKWNFKTRTTISAKLLPCKNEIQFSHLKEKFGKLIAVSYDKSSGAIGYFLINQRTLDKFSYCENVPEKQSGNDQLLT